VTVLSVGQALRPVCTLFAMAALTSACASRSSEPIDFQPQVVTADGLVQVRTSAVGGAYVKPGARLGGYRKVMIDPVKVSYKRTPRSSTRGAGLGDANFALDEKEMANLQRLFQESFEKEFSRSQIFEVVREPGPDVLRVSGWIIDLVVRAPRERAGSDVTFVRSAGEMTLVLDVRDSQSHAPLARIADRRAVQPAGGYGLYESNTVNITGELRRVFTRWARFLREGLDELQQLPAIPEAPSEQGDSAK
jgi:hypothetical protein